LDAVLPNSDLRRGRIGSAVGNVGGVCRDTGARRVEVTEVSVDRMTRPRNGKENFDRIKKRSQRVREMPNKDALSTAEEE
jgi:hypothetical protein